MPGEPKKTTTIYSRVPEEFKMEFKKSLNKLGFTEAFFLRAAAEALNHHVQHGEDLALPIRLLTVDNKRSRTPT